MPLLNKIIHLIKKKSYWSQESKFYYLYSLTKCKALKKTSSDNNDFELLIN